ncbi:MAG: metallophosphoesterase [Candidatus Korarchaeota archaeon]|nr:metallophosphoesterase [Thermoproteota archaeon]MCR8487944.1 metallophosphoesterase [Thermoproteota archaeon]MCR8501144.1 metallophosphoesterase [Thermoproteota archaeon]
MVSKLSKCALSILEIVFEKLKTNITPDALNILSVMFEILPKSLFEEIMKQLAYRVERHNISVIDKSDVQDAIKSVLYESRALPKTRTKSPMIGISEILEKATKRENKKHGRETEASCKSILHQMEQTPQQVLEFSVETRGRVKENVLASKQRQPEASYEEPLNKIFNAHIREEDSTEKLRAASIEAIQEKAVETVGTDKAAFSKKRDQIKASVRIVKTVPWYNLSDSPEAFRAYFLSRYEKLLKILEKNVGGRIIESLDLKPGEYQDTYVVIMVDSKEIAKNGKGGLIVGDDTYSRFKIYVPFDADPDLKAKFDRILEDTVIAVEIKSVKSERFVIASNIIFPDLPRVRTRNKSTEPTKILVAADLHVGSKQFMKDRFERLIEFLRGETKSPELNEIAGEIEYIILVGDLVDGVGIYPQQKDELAIFDQKSQYRILAEYLSKIPDDKLVIAIPGNHDASTRFIPQPPISEKFADALYDLSTVQILSNPAMVEIHGVKILLYHGQGLERIAGLFGVKLENVHEVTTELLRWRHLCPQWGLIPQAPTQEDHLVIEEEPDILLMGHVHISSHARHRGTVVLTAGSFEGLTAWQRDIGIVPTIGYFSVLDLQSYDLIIAEANEKGIEIVKSLRI